MNDLFDLVPCGTLLKHNINSSEEFKSPLNIYGNDLSYVDLLDIRTNHDINAVSYKSALDVLKFNSDYPISLLDKSELDQQIVSNYRNEVLSSSEISIKYKGYIQRERQMADKITRLENLLIPSDFDFDKVESLSIECRQKLKKYSPRTIAQASRISGVSPSDISVLLVYFGR